MRLIKLLVLIPVFLLSFFLSSLAIAEVAGVATIPTGALVWEECPDWGAEVSPSGSLRELNERGNICFTGPIVAVWGLNHERKLLADWYDAPYEGKIREDKEVRIVSIELDIKAKGCEGCSGSCSPKNIYTKVFSGVNQEGEWNYEIDGSADIGSMEWYNFSLDYIEANASGDYRIKIENTETSGCLRIDYLGLKTTYYLMGDAEILLGPLHVNETFIGKHSLFNVSSDVSCFGGDCGNVKAYLRYANYPSEPDLNVPEGSGTPMYAISNPYYCGRMIHDVEVPVCKPFWEVKGTKAGDYIIDFLADSDDVSVVDNDTENVVIPINPGVLSLSGVIGSSNINLTDNVLLTGTVECGTAPCGNVRILAKYKGSSGNFEVIGESGNLSTKNDNPQGCGRMEPGESCSKSWYVYGNEPGYYEIKLVAYSDDTDVENETSDLINLRVNPKRTVGVLSITNVRVSPDKINVSESATLYGTISCSQKDCGKVSVYAMSREQKITSDGLGSDENPKLCSDMRDGSSCSVSWVLTGNKADTYPIKILADSDQDGVENITSSVVYLLVRNPVGSLFFPGSQNPRLEPLNIDVSEIANLYAMVDCDSDYCGRATAFVKYNNINLGSSGDLNTNDQNPQTCDCPCEFSWNIRGSKSGSYEVKLLITSNESDERLFTSYGLTVKDPSKPSLSVSLGDLLGKYELGKPFTLKGEVRCDNGNCGEMRVYAKYKESPEDPWSYLTLTSPLSTPENPKTINLNSDESEQVEWIVNSSSVGNYILGISADANDTNVIDSPAAARGIEIFRGVNIGIDIESPDAGKRLFRGDEFLIKARITEDGNPMVGGFVTALSEGFFPVIELNESGDGIYSKPVKVGSEVRKGPYIIRVFVKKGSQTFNKTTNVYVNPELNVILDIDKNGYEIFEKAIIQGQVLKNRRPVKANIWLKLVCQEWKTNETVLVTDDSGNYLYKHVISRATPPGKCRFELNTEDQNKNYNFTFKEVDIVPSEKDVYKIDFLSPGEGTRYKKGDSVRIRIRVLYAGDPLEGAGVLCMDPMFGESIQLNETENGIYLGEYSIPKEAPSESWILTCVASTPDEYFGREDAKVYITPLELKLTKISPSETDFFQPSDVANISLRLMYPDNKPFRNASVYLKIGDKIIYLNETKPGVYEGEYKIESQGSFKFDVYAEDSFGNTGFFENEITLIAGVGGLNLLWFALPFVIAVVLLAGVVWRRGGKVIIKKEIPAKPRIDRKRWLRNRIAELERKKRNIQEAKDVVEQEYYERKIDEKTFNRMIQNYEQQIISLNVEIEDLKRELANL